MANEPNLNLEQIYQHYRDIVREHTPKRGRILKAGAENEMASESLGIEDVDVDWDTRATYLEIGQGVIDAAYKNFPLRTFIQGSIVKMEFADGVFACVIDLSTIDHLLRYDVSKAIGEYWRVLRPGGKLIMVAWCADDPNQKPMDWGGPQYFLYERDLLDCLEGWNIGETSVFHRQEGGLYLLHIIATKPRPPRQPKE